MRGEDCQQQCCKDHSHGLSDVSRLKELFSQQNFEYTQPDWGRLRGKVLVDDNDVVVIALLDRPTVEMYALVDSREWATPGMKAANFEMLDRASRIDLRARGYEDQHCWVPPARKAFARRMQKFFGWVQSSDPADPWLGLVRKI